MPWLQRVARWPWTASSRVVGVVGDFAQRARGATRHHTRPIVIPETQELLAPVPAVLTLRAHAQLQPWRLGAHSLSAAWTACRQPAGSARGTRAQLSCDLY